jgi:GT2 family glycosyltransferase
MDENFYPAWFEDDDYAIRVHHSGMKAVRYNDTPLLHGDINGSLDYVSGMMTTLYKTRRMGNDLWQWRKMFEAGQVFSKTYLESKWGIRITRRNRFDCKGIDSMNGECKTGFLTPFHNPQYNLSYWQLNETVRSIIVAAALK